MQLAGILNLSQTINQFEINDPSNSLKKNSHIIAQKESFQVSGILDCRLLQTLKYVINTFHFNQKTSIKIQRSQIKFYYPLRPIAPSIYRNGSSAVRARLKSFLRNVSKINF